MNFKQYLTESEWDMEKANDFIAKMEPTFKKAHITVEVIGSVKTKGESDNDLDLKVIKFTSTSWEKLIKELKKHPDIADVEVLEQDIKYGDMITINLKPDRKVVDIIFGFE
jgi:hypothetical protein